MMLDGRNPARASAAIPAGRDAGRFVAPAAMLLLGASDAATAQPLTERVEHAIEIVRDTRITVMNFAGHVEIHGTDPGEDRTLRIVGVKRLEADLPAEEAARIFEQVNLDLRRRGRQIHVGPNRPRRHRPRRPSGERSGETPITEVRTPRRIPPVSVDLELWLPENASLEVHTFTAPITVTGVTAPEASFLLRSISGSLQIDGLECHDLRAETVSGDLSLADVRSRQSTLKTLTASIHLNGDLASEGWYELQTHSGAVVLGLGPLPAFAVDATTYIGEIRNELDFQGAAGPRSLEGRRGSEGPNISVNSFSGLIHLTADTGWRSATERER